MALSAGFLAYDGTTCNYRESRCARTRVSAPHNKVAHDRPIILLVNYVIRGVFSFFFFFLDFPTEGKKIFERKGMRIMNGLLETNFLNLAEIIFSIDVFFCNVKLLR